MVSSSRRRRVRLTVAGVVVLAAAAAGTTIGLLRYGPSSGTGTANPTTTTTTAPPDSTTTTTRPPAPTPIGCFGVATTSVPVTVPGSSAAEDQLPTSIWYPTSPSATCTPARSHPFPLLVFSQGFWEPVSAYAGLLADWASAGFVVGAPAYPHTTPTRAAESPYTETDIVHHPADLAAVVTTLMTTSRQPGSVLHGIVDATDVGLAGQSDGGDVSLAVADNSCCRIGTVKAVAILSGAEFKGFPGQYFTPGAASPPILVAQGTADPVNVPACSVQIFNAAPSPKYYLELLGATHLAPYVQATPWQSAVAAVTTDFFEAELAHEPGALAAMATAGDVSGTAQLSEGPTAPEAPGPCTDAPGAS